MKTFHIRYADGSEADLPAFAAGLVPGLVIVRDDENGDYGRPYGIIHAESCGWLKPTFGHLKTAKAALLAVKDLAPWTGPKDGVFADRARVVPVREALEAARRAEVAQYFPKAMWS